jgi:hypothetical protein
VRDDNGVKSTPTATLLFLAISALTLIYIAIQDLPDNHDLHSMPRSGRHRPKPLAIRPLEPDYHYVFTKGLTPALCGHISSDDYTEQTNVQGIPLNEGSWSVIRSVQITEEENKESSATDSKHRDSHGYASVLLCPSRHSHHHSIKLRTRLINSDSSAEENHGIAGNCGMLVSTTNLNPVRSKGWDWKADAPEVSGTNHQPQNELTIHTYAQVTSTITITVTITRTRIRTRNS